MAPPSKPPDAEPEGPKKKVVLDDSTRKSSLVQGELKDLEAMRKEGGGSRRASVRTNNNNCCDDFQYSLKIVGQNPRILILSLFVFAVLCGGGLGLVFFLANDEDQNAQDDASDLAVETGRWFGKLPSG